MDAERFARGIAVRRETWVDQAVEWIAAPMAAVFAWPVVVYMGVNEWTRRRRAREAAKEFAVTCKHLQQRRTIEEIEAGERIQDPLGAVPDLAFGHLNPAWAKFKANLRPDDELWRFSATWTKWGRAELREGYAVLRGEEIGPWFLAGRRQVKDRRR